VPTVRSVSIDQRLEWARAAMAWFLVFVEHPPEGISRTEIESAAISALEVPQLQELSLEILGQLATPKSQSALVEAVSRNDWPIALRVKALGAFRKAVEKRGVQLTTQQILQQYERYKHSIAARSAKDSGVDSRLHRSPNAGASGGNPGEGMRSSPRGLLRPL